MPQNFLECDREQVFLMPPDPRDWLPEDHLAWFVLASVEQMDLSAFFAAYRRDGWGRAAFEPSMMVSLLLYAYARGERSSRGIERRRVEDVAYRVIAAQQKPDHATIARFRARHEDALAELFTEVLALCKQAGLVKVGVIAIDGTKVHANASHHSNLDYEQLARRSSGRPARSMRLRMSSMAMLVAMSCPSTFRPARGVVLLCGRQSNSSSVTAPRTGAQIPRLARRSLPG
jgi:transposase